MSAFAALSARFFPKISTLAWNLAHTSQYVAYNSLSTEDEHMGV